MSEKEKDDRDDDRDDDQDERDAAGEKAAGEKAAGEKAAGEKAAGEKAADEKDEKAADEPGDDERSEATADEADRAARVAEALGVAPEDGDIVDAQFDGEPAKAEEAGPPNRAQRRREEAIERRRKRKGLPAKKEGEGELPKDKNKRAKELLQRRREAATEDRPAQLDAGEMVDDALARGWAGTTKWLRSNLATIQWVVALGLLGVAGYVGFTYFTQKKLGAASGLLASGAMAESGAVMAEDKRSDDEKDIDPTLVFKTAAERDDKALASYREVQQKYEGSGAAILGKLGEAGVLLDKREWDKAAEAYDAVLKTQLAMADPDVKGRAIEGLALAKEGKGDVEGASAEYRRLDTIDAKGFKELSQYHQARLLLAKNTDDDRAKAKDMLKALYDKLKEPALDKKPMPYLERSVEQALRNLDPTLVPDRDSLSGVRGGQMSPEELQQRIRKLQEELGKKPDGEHGH